MVMVRMMRMMMTKTWMRGWLPSEVQMGPVGVRNGSKSLRKPDDEKGHLITMDDKQEIYDQIHNQLYDQK